MKKRIIKKRKIIQRKKKHQIMRRGGSLMNNQEVNWEDSQEELDQFKGGNSDIKKLDVTPGDHKLALIGNPFFFRRHWLDKQKRSVNCPGDGCPICATGDFPVGRYAVNVYVYKNEDVEILEFGRQIKQSIANAIKLWGGDINAFDLIYTRVGKGKEDTKYSTAQVPRLKKLSAEVSPYDLSKIFKPTPVEKIVEILEEPAKTANTQANTTTKQKTTDTSTAVNKDTVTTPKSPAVQTQEDIVSVDDMGGIDLDKLIEDDKS